MYQKFIVSAGIEKILHFPLVYQTTGLAHFILLLVPSSSCDISKCSVFLYVKEVPIKYNALYSGDKIEKAERVWKALISQAYQPRHTNHRDGNHY